MGEDQPFDLTKQSKPFLKSVDKAIADAKLLGNDLTECVSQIETLIRKVRNSK